MYKVPLTLLLALPFMAQASTLYRCSDEFGHTTYTNYKTGNRKCTVMSRDSGPTTSSDKSGGGSAAKPSPTDFPKVAGDTQKRRDGDRRYILEQELDTEQKHLAEEQKSLAEKIVAKAAPDMLQPIRDRVALHERNLDALRREISNLK